MYTAAAHDRTGYYGYGSPATAAEIAGWDIDIRPDGTGLPEGSGSVADGEPLYEEKCAECHGSFGEGVGRFPVLAGGEGTLTDPRPTKTVGSYWAHTSTLWDYIRRTMPFAAPESLEDDEVYALTAYVLYLNDLVDDDFVLDKMNFTSVALPNRNNFIPDERPDVRNVRCMENCKSADDIEITSSVLPAENIPASRTEVERKPEPGEIVYDQYCSICHRPPGLNGAPLLGDSLAWKKRTTAGIAKLKLRAKNGFTGSKGVMPPRGGFMSLSNEEVDEAVEYMVESSL
jgi:S-disulfanyl-L-cysteine oxidoreductase SoxD